MPLRRFRSKRTVMPYTPQTQERGYERVTVNDIRLRQDILRIIGWITVLPALAFWPLLSVFPGLALLTRTGSSLEISVQVVLFITGFWGVAALYILFQLLLSDAEKARLATRRREKGLLIGGFATIWTILFFIAAFASR